MPWVSVALFIFLATPTPGDVVKPGADGKRPSAAKQAPTPAARQEAAPTTRRAPAARRPDVPAALRPDARRPSARPPAARRPLVDDKGRPAIVRSPPPASRPLGVAPKTAARQAAPATRQASTRAAPTPRAATQAPSYTVPWSPDQSVQIIGLSNGLSCWCKSMKQASVTQLRLAVAAGTATDMKGLSGTAKLLGELLRERLNQPRNPPHASVPMGGSFYRVKTQKDWALIEAQLQPDRVKESLTHIAKALKSPPASLIPIGLRDTLKRGASNFPPPAMLERVESYLFHKQPHGRLIRGEKQTFQTIQSFRLQTAWEALYRAHRMRLLVVGRVDCDRLARVLPQTLGELPNTTGKKEKVPLYVKSQLSPSGRLALTQELLSLYNLPALTREDAGPLWLLAQIAERELKQSLSAAYGTFPLRSKIQEFPHNGYLLFALPSHPTQRRALGKVVKKSLGTLRMQPYPPALKERIKMRYRVQIANQLRGLMDSSQGMTSLLLPQLLLPAGKEKQPRSLLPLVEQVNPEMIRHLARKYMGQQVSYAAGQRDASLPRIILFLVTLLLVWVLLDQTFRRSRRKEE